MELIRQKLTYYKYNFFLNDSDKIYLLQQS